MSNDSQRQGTRPEGRSAALTLPVVRHGRKTAIAGSEKARGLTAPMRNEHP